MKVIIIAVACLTAGTGLAGCEASSSATEATATAETTATTTTTATVKVDGEKFTGVYYKTDGKFMGYADWMPGTVYLNGEKYNGSFEDFPEIFYYVVDDSNGRSTSIHDKSEFPYETAPMGFENGVPFW